MTATMPAEEPALDVYLHDDLVPRVAAGEYRITVAHTLTAPDGSRVDADDPLPDVHQDIDVRSPQFTLDPSHVHAAYPAPGSTADLATTLAHVTLDRATLPWERDESGAERRTPWLALLLFTEGELPGDPAAQGSTDTRTVADLLNGGGAGVLTPAISPNTVPADVLTSSCRTLDVPAAVFTAVCPRSTELRRLAHVRRVVKPKSTGPTDGGEVLSEGDFAVVVGNRLPRSPGWYAAHLVSLEGLADHLDGTLPEGVTAVRLVSLRAWSFCSKPDAGAHFGALLDALAEPGRTDPAALTLRLPVPADAPAPATGAQQAALDRIRAGWFPVGHRTASGEHSFAWYRGPFTPVAAQPLPQPVTLGRADEALVYDQEFGIFDVGYAGAFTLGRAAALADTTYAASLTTLRRQVRGHAIALLAGIAVGADPSGPQPHPGHDALARLITGGTVTRRASQPRPRLAELHHHLHREELRSPLRRTVAARADAVTDWVDRLALLQPVPFPHLVPDARALPPESLRFFRVDAQWITALIAGGLSVGADASSLDHTLGGLIAEEAAPAAVPAAGLLLRSTLVRGWPALPVQASLAGNPVTTLRRDTPAPDVLLLLFDAVPDQVTFREPHQGLHFGLDDGPNGSDVIRLRRLAADAGGPLGSPTGALYPDDGTSVTGRHLRPVAEGATPSVLDLAGTSGLPAGLGTALGAELTPADLALELLDAPVSLTFR
ncbi:hypothetical protein ACGF13_35915 [Kitasatospora sp. NPDC048286]|uniref:hypothetical protein n=1 Tax=Kitasatospora sp. NPDC048286 TaxID=3364047 RepID=UPI003721F346